MGLKQDGRGTQGGSKGQNNKQTGLANSIIRGLCSPEKRSRRVRFEQPEIQQQVGLRRVISQGHHRVAKPGSSLRIFHRPPSVVFPIGSLALPPITKSDTVELSGSPIVQNRDEKSHGSDRARRMARSCAAVRSPKELMYVCPLSSRNAQRPRGDK